MATSNRRRARKEGHIVLYKEVAPSTLLAIPEGDIPVLSS